MPREREKLKHHLLQILVEGFQMVLEVPQRSLHSQILENYSAGEREEGKNLFISIALLEGIDQELLLLPTAPSSVLLVEEGIATI